MSLWGIAAAVAVVSTLIRIWPELVLRGREPPAWVRAALPWLPVAVAGTFVGIMHFGAAPAVRIEYILAGAAGALTLLWRRTFYGPLVVGALTLALVRAAS